MASGFVMNIVGMQIRSGGIKKSIEQAEQALDTAVVGGAHDYADELRSWVAEEEAKLAKLHLKLRRATELLGLKDKATLSTLKKAETDVLIAKKLRLRAWKSRLLAKLTERRMESARLQRTAARTKHSGQSYAWFLVCYACLTFFCGRCM